MHTVTSVWTADQTASVPQCHIFQVIRHSGVNHNPSDFDELPVLAMLLQKAVAAIHSSLSVNQTHLGRMECHTFLWQYCQSVGAIVTFLFFYCRNWSHRKKTAHCLFHVGATAHNSEHPCQGNSCQSCFRQICKFLAYT